MQEYIKCDPSKKADNLTEEQIKLINYAIREIFYCEMLVRGMGVKDAYEPYGHYFNDDEIKEINLLIKKVCYHQVTMNYVI